MEKKIKLITVVGTRPEIIRLSSIIKKFDKSFNHKLVFTGQNFSKELSTYFFKNFEIKPDIFLKVNNQNPFNAIGEIIIKMDKILDEFKPDCFFVVGDTNSALSSMVAKKKQIPVFHYEAGNRCFDERVPEEVNRMVIDTLSDVNLTYSESSKLNLLKENFSLDKIFNVGSPLHEVFQDNLKKIKKNEILKKLKLKEKNYIVLSLHREENVENKKNLDRIINSINYISEKMKKVIIFSTHPRTRKKLKNYKLNKLIKIYPPFDFFSYNRLQISSSAVISDSGSISEESYILNFPAINLRETHERHEAMENGVLIMSEFEKNKLLTNLKFSIKNHTEYKHHTIKDYDQKNPSLKIIKIISSYINYVNKKTYYKN
jgi:UDP-N-acetyl-L-fucosamine synthase